MHPVITIFCAFTRRWAVDEWLDNLAKTTHDPALTNLCIIVDCEELYIFNQVKKFAEERGYRSFHGKMNSGWHPNEVRLSIRRQRVADIHNQSKDLIAKTDGDLIVGLEDDTIFDRDPNWLMQLIEPFAFNLQLGFNQGVQVGRWGANIVGVWEFDNIHIPTEVKTLLPSNGIGPITAGGFYGYVTRRHLYMNHDYYTSSSQPWGPDVNYGVWVHQQDFTCMVNWDVLFGHKDYSKILYPDSPDIRLAQIVYNKDTNTGKWMRTDHEPNRF